MKIKRIALIGMGAIGSYLASCIAPVLGDDFAVIAGGKRGQKLKEDGMIINGEEFYFNVYSPDEIFEADLVIIITKMGGLDQALRDVRNAIGVNTLIMCPLNGVESEDKVAKVYGYDNLIYSLTRASVVKEGNRVSFNPEMSHMEFGEKDKSEFLSERIEAIKEVFEICNIKCVTPKDMQKAIWEKFVCNVGENQVAAVTGANFGAWWKSDHANYLRVKTSEEVIAIARAKGINIKESYAKEHIERLKKLPPENRASTLQDIECGRHTEVDMFAGAVIRMGKELGIPTPFNDFLYHAIKVIEEKNDGVICNEV